MGVQKRSVMKQTVVIIGREGKSGGWGGSFGILRIAALIFPPHISWTIGWVPPHPLSLFELELLPSLVMSFNGTKIT